MSRVAILGLLAVVLAGCNQFSSVKNIVTDENTEADFGIVREKKGPVSANLLYVNDTRDTLVPVSVRTRCSCVVAGVDSEPVAPGETLKVYVTYNPAYRQGIFMEEIGVKCKDRPGFFSFIIKGEVIPMEHPVEEDYPYDFGDGLHLSHEVMHFGRMAPGQRSSMFIRYASTLKKASDLTFEVADTRYDGSVSFVRTHRIDKGGRDTLQFGFTMPDGLTPGDTLYIPLQPYVGGKAISKPLMVKAIAK